MLIEVNGNLLLISVSFGSAHKCSPVPSQLFSMALKKAKVLSFSHQEIEATKLSTNCLKYWFDAHPCFQKANSGICVHLQFKKKKKKCTKKCRTLQRSLQPDMAGYISLNNNSNWILLVSMTAPLTYPIEHSWQEQLQSGWPIDPATWTFFLTSAFSDF